MKTLPSYNDSLQFIYEIYDVNKAFIPEHNALYLEAESKIHLDQSFAKRIKLSFFNIASSRISKTLAKNSMMTKSQSDSLELEYILEEIDKELRNTKSAQRKIELNQYKETTLQSLYDKERIQDFCKRFISEFPNSYVADSYRNQLKEMNVIATNISSFTLKDLNHKNIKLSDFKGRYVVLNFWTEQSNSYHFDFPTMVEEYEKFDKRQVEIVSICLDMQGKDLKKYLDSIEFDWQAKMEWTHLQTEKNDLREALNIRIFPTNFLMDPSGKIIIKNDGLRVGFFGSRIYETVMREIDKVHN